MNVLCVEDNELNRQVVSGMLAVAGARSSEAESAESGLAMIDSNTYDLVLMDLRMPGMDGLTAIRHLRERTDEKAGMPVVVLTADAAPNLRARCLEAGANEVLRKPIAMSTLLKALGRIMMGPGTAVIT